jgi:general stress protein 26
MNEGLDKLYSHIDDIEIAMMTTRRTDGHLQSRAMATQRRAGGADLWFVTLEDTRS